MNVIAEKTAEHYARLLAPLGSDVKLGIINSLSASLLKIETERPKRPLRSFGMAKGELRYPDDIDFCNDEIAEMFGVNA
ncbi:MAG: hypothetical protein K2N31_05300 [Treponemataceae bacterium]|nr:hypothetical protein [Treponemataceae bacterium]